MARLEIGSPSGDFNLKGVDNRNYSLDDFREKEILVLMFTCNHCPYVQAYEARLISIQRDYISKGVVLVAINSNSEIRYPEDSFDRMVQRAREKGYNFPYLRDADQTVAAAYKAEYTPEIFVFDKRRKLRYHGRIDNSKDETKVTSRDLRGAIDSILSGKEIIQPETHAFGCTIKWADDH